MTERSMVSWSTAPVPPVGKVALAAAGGALLGSFLPWVSVFALFGKIEFSGFDGRDGKLTAAAAIAAMLLGYFGLVNRQKVAVIVGLLAAAGGFAVAIHYWAGVTESMRIADQEEISASVSVGYGLYACLASFVVCIVCLALTLPSNRDDDDWEIAYDTTGWKPDVLDLTRHVLRAQRIDHQLVVGELIVAKRDEAATDAVIVACSNDTIDRIVESRTEIAYDTTGWTAATLLAVVAKLQEHSIAYNVAGNELIIDKLDEPRADDIIVATTGAPVTMATAVQVPQPALIPRMS